MKIRASDGRMFDIPNNPLQAYIKGRQHGSQEQMDKVAMALTDKAGWHVAMEDPEDRQTNADKYFRNATDEEIVEAWYFVYHNVIFNSTNSRLGLLQWLKQEVESDA